MADGSHHLENRYIAISQWKIIRFWWNFLHSSKFWTGWTSRDQRWRSCIGQTPSSTERISCGIEICILLLLLLLVLTTPCMIRADSVFLQIVICRLVSSLEMYKGFQAKRELVLRACLCDQDWCRQPKLSITAAMIKKRPSFMLLFDDSSARWANAICQLVSHAAF